MAVKVNKRGIAAWILILLSFAFFAYACVISIARPISNSKRWFTVTEPAAIPETSSEDSGQETSESTEEQKQGIVLEESPRVSDEYFSDAVFAGDSLTIGLQLYGPNQDLTVVAYTGINTQSAMTEEFYTTPEGDTLTMADAINYYHPRKIYLMLGCNGINWATPDWLITYYDQLTDIIEEKNPDAYIILESIFATTRAKSQTDDFLKLENIIDFNTKLKEMCIRKGYYYLDVYSAICTDEGYLPESIAANDGTHLKTEGYNMWYDYICTHTIQADSDYQVDSDGRIRLVNSTSGD
jgi:lysophospholipase L1-like esterase